jgi:uncharacterized membrane protein
MFVTGIASILNHGTHWYGFGIADVIAMAITIYVMTAGALWCWCQSKRKWTSLFVIVMTVSCGIATVTMASTNVPYGFELGFAIPYLIDGTIVPYLLMKRAPRVRRKPIRWLMGIAIGFGLIGFASWCVDRWLCSPFVNGMRLHAIWHASMGVTSFLIMLVYTAIYSEYSDIDFKYLLPRLVPMSRERTLSEMSRA